MLVVIVVEEDRAVAGIVLSLAQDSPGLTILEHPSNWGPWTPAGPVCIQQFMETQHIDSDSLMYADRLFCHPVFD